MWRRVRGNFSPLNVLRALSLSIEIKKLEILRKLIIVRLQRWPYIILLYLAPIEGLYRVLVVVFDGAPICIQVYNNCAMKLIVVSCTVVLGSMRLL